MKFRVLVLILTLLLLTSCSGNPDSDRFFSINFYEDEVIPSTTYLERGEIAAIEFYAAEEFSGIEVLAAKMNEDDTLTVTLYKFDTDYETTLKDGKEVEKATFRDYESRDTLMLSFKTVPSGKYLLTFSTKNSAGICVASYPSEQASDNVKFYLNSTAYTDGAYYAAVIFNGDRLNINYFKEKSAQIPEIPTDTQLDTQKQPDSEPEIPIETENNPEELPGYEPEVVN